MMDNPLLLAPQAVANTGTVEALSKRLMETYQSFILENGGLGYVDAFTAANIFHVFVIADLEMQLEDHKEMTGKMRRTFRKSAMDTFRDSLKQQKGYNGA